MNQILGILIAVFLTSTTVFATPPWPKIPEGDFEALRVFLRGNIHVEDEPETPQFEARLKGIYQYLKENPDVVNQGPSGLILSAKLLQLFGTDSTLVELSKGLSSFSQRTNLSTAVALAYENWGQYVNKNTFFYLKRNEPSDAIRGVLKANATSNFPRGLGFEETVRLLSEKHTDSEYSAVKFREEIQAICDQYSVVDSKSPLLPVDLSSLHDSRVDLNLSEIMWLLWLSAENDIQRIHVIGYMDFLIYFRSHDGNLKKFTQTIIRNAFDPSLWDHLVQWEIYHRRVSITWPCPYFSDTNFPRPQPEELTKIK
jgi:hypothetical protein